MRNVHQLGEIAILYLSAFPKRNAEDHGLLDLGEHIRGYITKPFSIDDLLERVKSALEAH